MKGRDKNKGISRKILVSIFIIIFFANTWAFGLAPRPASQDPSIKRKIYLILKGTEIVPAESEFDRKILRANNTSCLLLSNGKCLMVKKLAERLNRFVSDKKDSDDSATIIEILSLIKRAEIEALMQINARQNEKKYAKIKEKVLEVFPMTKGNLRDYYPRPRNLRKDKLTPERYVDHIVARAFQWITLREEGMISADEIPDSEKEFVRIFKRKIQQTDAERGLFTREYRDSAQRRRRIRKALNEGMVLYRVPHDVGGSADTGVDPSRGKKGKNPEESTISELLDSGTFEEGSRLLTAVVSIKLEFDEKPFGDAYRITEPLKVFYQNPSRGAIQQDVKEALSEIYVAEEKEAIEVLESIKEARSRLVSKKTLDEKLVAEMKAIAKKMRTPRAFMDALSLEVKFSSQVSTGRRKLSDGSYYCEDYGTNHSLAVLGKVVQSTVFSIYSDCFDSTDELGAYVSYVARRLEEDPSLEARVVDKEGLNTLLIELRGSFVESNDEGVRFEQSSRGNNKKEDESTDRIVKCVVLDCDGVLWGGIVGEVGVEGIVLDGPHLGFQRKMKKLKDNGVLLAINSRNSLRDIEEVFKNRTDMVLKLKDFSAVRANWKDKGKNIGEIALELNIGLPEMMFLDDTMHEREAVRFRYPEVLVPDMPDDPGNWLDFLEEFKLLEVEAITREDKARARSYNARKLRDEVYRCAPSREAFLESLDIRITVHEARAEDAKRIAQLTQRTNQFNLTDARRTEEEIASLMERNDARILVCKAKDRFEDFGIVGVIVAEESIYHRKDWFWEISVFCMSCRVLGLDIEKAFLVESMLVMRREYGVRVLNAGFYKTHRNTWASGFYEECGFMFSKETGYYNISFSADLRRVNPPQSIKINYGDLEKGFPPELFDTDKSVELLFDLLNTANMGEREYTIKYDADRLTPAQAGLIEEYAKMSGRIATGFVVKTNPYSGKKTKSESSLISVYCSAGGFQGESHVDISVPENDLGKYLLRVTGILNMAIASASIPEETSEADEDDYVRKLLSFIRKQYYDIMGEEIDFPETIEEILSVIKNIVLFLPSSDRLSEKLLDDYYSGARKALLSV